MQKETYKYSISSGKLDYGINSIKKPNNIRLLQTEIEHLKFNNYWNQYINTLIVKLMIYVTLIVIALNILITINTTIKWINSIVFVVPFIESYYSNDKVWELIKIVFSTKYKSSAKTKLYKKWKHDKVFSLIIPSK